MKFMDTKSICCRDDPRLIFRSYIKDDGYIFNMYAFGFLSKTAFIVSTQPRRDKRSN